VEDALGGFGLTMFSALVTPVRRRYRMLRIFRRKGRVTEYGNTFLYLVLLACGCLVTLGVAAQDRLVFPVHP